MELLTRLFPLALAAGLQVAAPTVEPGFTSLFNGKDFAGWKIAGPTESFTIQDGAIVAKGATSHCYYDGAFHNHSFRPHLRAAQASGKPIVVLQLPGVALDIDRPADLVALAEAAGATRAQQLVRHWQAVDRPTNVAVALK